jgi:hypothetical protein
MCSLVLPEVVVDQPFPLEGVRQALRRTGVHQMLRNVERVRLKSYAASERFPVNEDVPEEAFRFHDQHRVSGFEFWEQSSSKA